MDVHVRGLTNLGPTTTPITEEELGMDDVKKGPWTDEEDALLMNYVRVHGEGRWNSVAHFAGLKRTGKSCRLRWLNYLRPDVRRGNITLEEQLMILDLHSRWGNRWSKIAKYLPGRTDNEIKNYWRTRVQKQAKQLKCDVNSKQFRDVMRYVWMPRMIERVQANSSGSTTGHHPMQNPRLDEHESNHMDEPIASTQAIQSGTNCVSHAFESQTVTPEMSGVTSTDSSDAQLSPHSDLSECYNPLDYVHSQAQLCPYPDNTNGQSDWTQVAAGFDTDRGFNETDNMWMFDGGDDQSLLLDDFWSEENIGFLQRQLSEEDFSIV